MTIGIYKLVFKGTDKVYIGQSLHIEYRLKQHITKLLNKNHSVKMNNAYKEFGLPELEILEECVEEQLNELENHHIALCNTVDNGFNSLYHAEDTPNKRVYEIGKLKYTKEQINRVFFLLIEQQEMLFREIAVRTEVSIGMITQISRCASHIWLKNDFPNEYAILEKLKYTRDNHKSSKSRGITYPLILSPLEVIYNVENMCQFAKEHNLDKAALSRLLNKKQKTTKGWKLA